MQATAAHDKETNPQPAKGGGLFEGLSVAQVSAGALAAVTSMLLSSRIGITGSVIGVAVGSVVSAVASQVYKKFFEASADKLKATIDFEGETVQMSAVDQGGTVAMESSSTPDETVAMSEEEIQQAVKQYSLADDATTAGTHYERGSAGRGAHAGIDSKKVAKMAVVVSVVAALVAVAISAFVIDRATSGEGIGTKTQPVIVTRSAQDSSDQSTDASGTDASSSEGSSSSSDSSTDKSKTDASSNKDGATTNNSSSNDSSANSASDSANTNSGSGQGTSTDNNNASSNGTSSNGASSNESSSGNGSSSSDSGSNSNSGTSENSSSGTSSSSNNTSGGSSSNGSVTTQDNAA